MTASPSARNSKQVLVSQNQGPGDRTGDHEGRIEKETMKVPLVIVYGMLLRNAHTSKVC